MKAPKNFQFIKKPYQHQWESFVFALKRNNAGILLDLGLGKTKVAIDVARYRIQHSNVDKVLVVCPTSILVNWKNEIQKFSEYKAVILHAPRQERRRRLFLPNYHFYIINYESLFPIFKSIGILKPIGMPPKWKYIDNKPKISYLISKLNFKMIIFDESARYIKNHQAKRTRASILLADHAQYKLILTGTPIANKPLDVWSQYRVLDGGKTFGTNFYQFRNRYFMRLKMGMWDKWVMKKSSVDIFSSKIYSVSIRKTKDEIAQDFPKRINQVIELKPTGELLKIYKKVYKQIISEIDTKGGNVVLEVNNILTKLLRLQQITSGFVGTRKRGFYELNTTPKLDALIDEIESVVDANESVVVWCRFRKSIELISKRLDKLKVKYITMSGKDSDKYKKWKGFQKSKTKNVFIGQVESGGIGIELFKHESDAKKSQYMIFFENTWSLDTREQALGRIHRIGQKSLCVYKDLVVKHTIDERILESIKENKKIADLILEKGVKGWLNRK